MNQLSEKILLAVKMGKDTSILQQQIKDIQLDELKGKLNNDHQKKSFWINIYNAYFLILRKELKVDKPDIYTQKLFTIAGQAMSLDDVEHGILRKYRYKYSLGFFPNIFAAKLIKNLAVEQIDYRIHFALNCGAESCPPIAFYQSENIDSQLDMATQSFLEGETDFDDGKKEVHTTTLFKWFYGDFGARRGIRKIYKEQLGKDISDYKIIFKPYSWEENLDNFV